MLQNAYLLAKIGADTAENEQHFAEILPKNGNYPTALTGVPVPGSYDTAASKIVLNVRIWQKSKSALEVGIVSISVRAVRPAAA